MTTNAPFSLAQVKAINDFQQKCDMFSKLDCGCGGLLFATEAGLVCRKCFNETHAVPLFIANGSWNRFRKPAEPEIEEDQECDDDYAYFMD